MFYKMMYNEIMRNTKQQLDVLDECNKLILLLNCVTLNQDSDPVC